MKTRLLFAAILAVAIPTHNIQAQSANELAFRQARAARDKAAADAMEPINRRYKEQLGQLFKKATQAAELDLANAIRTELQAVGGAAAVGEVTATKPGAAPVSATGATLAKTDLKKLFENTRWDMTSPYTDRYILFLRNGECKGTGFGIARFTRYTLEAPDILRLHPKEKKGEKPTFAALRVDVSAMTATQDQSKSTEPGTLALKYAGPAPKK